MDAQTLAAECFHRSVLRVVAALQQPHEVRHHYPPFAFAG